MKLIKYPFLSVLLLGVIACDKPAAASPERFGANFSFATCVRHAGDVDTLAALFKERGINQLPPDLADNFLNGASGKAWSFTSPDGQFAVTYKNDGVCTVFIKKADVNAYIAEANLNLGRIAKNVGWAFSPEEVSNFAGKKALKSFTVIGESKDNRKVNVILSATHSTSGNYQIALNSSVL